MAAALGRIIKRTTYKRTFAHSGHGKPCPSIEAALRISRQMRTTLNLLQPGDQATVLEMNGDHETVERLMELGLVEGTTLKLHKFAPLGDPLEIVMRGYHLSLRCHEAASIVVEKL